MTFNPYEVIKAAVPDLDGRMQQFVTEGSTMDDELLEVFVQQLEDDLDSLVQQDRPYDMNAVARAAHSIKGMSGSVGAPEVSVLAQELEQAAHNNSTQRVVQLLEIMQACQQGYQSMRNT